MEKEFILNFIKIQMDSISRRNEDIKNKLSRNSSEVLKSEFGINEGKLLSLKAVENFVKQITDFSAATKEETQLLNQLKKANKDRIKDFGHFDFNCWSLPEWGNAVAGETGELCNVIKKVHRGDFTLEEANEKELIADEAADVVIYLDILCQRSGIDLQTAIVNKFNKKSDEIGSDVKIYYY